VNAVMPIIDLLIAQMINGVIYGSIYCLVAIGLALIFGVMDLVNFAHGEFYMLGGYAGFFLVTLLFLDPITATVISFFILAAVGVAADRIVIRPIRQTREAHHNLFLATLGISVTLQNLALLVWGAWYYGRPYYFEGVVVIFGNIISVERVVVFVLSIVTTAALWFMLQRTKTGTAIRAVSQSKDAALLVGIDINKIYMLTMGLSAGLAGVAGSLLAPLLLVYPTVGLVVIFKSFVVVSLGGFGNVKGAIVAAYILGIVEAVTVTLLSSSYQDIVSFGILILVLILKPSGLFGIKER
jgi:branched-chain amino acid transport system permease protein